MKHIHIIIVYLIMLMLVPFQQLTAQTAGEIELTGGLKMDDEQAVKVAFRTVDREDLMGGISVIDVTELMKKAYSLNSFDYLTAVTGGFRGNGLWGMNELLVVIDGIVRDDNNVLPSEIEQVTLLKGASAIALYGSRGAKGVIQITTKRGKLGERKFSIRANSGMHTPKEFPKYLGSAEYMTLYNEARVNDGLTPSYTDEQIYNHGSGLNPYRYPDLNYYSSDYLKKMYNRSEVMAEISGGSAKAKFNTTTGYYRESEILKVGNSKNNNTSRMFVRGNIDLALHELVTAKVNANAIFFDSKSAKTSFGANGSSYWQAAARLRPFRYAPLIPLSYIEENDKLSKDLLATSNYIIDGKYFLGSTQLDQVNPIAAAYAAGDSSFIRRQFQFDGGLDINLRDVLKGLMFRMTYGVDYQVQYGQHYTNSYATFSPTWTDYAGDDRIASLTQYSSDNKTGNQNISSQAYRTTTLFSAQFDYNATYNEDHNLFAMLLAHGWQRIVDGQYHRYSNANLGLQLSYNFRQKYYADFTAAAPYSAKLPEGNRLGFSPTGTLGWRVSKESFMANQSVFDDLVLNVSGGIIQQDLDITTSDNRMGYFLYKHILTRAGWWSWGDLGGENATEFQRGANPNLTFVKRKEFTAGIRGSMWDKSIVFNANYFINRMDGGLTRAASLYPVYFIQTGNPSSSIVPYVNYNIDQYQGVDFSVYFNKKADQVDLQLGVSGMYQTDKALRRDENYEFDYQTRVGRPLNSIWGLQNLGFFMSQDDIKNSPAQSWGALKPGDIKYKKQNDGSAVDSNDEIFLGRGTSPLTLGLNFTASWKNFSLFAMGTGFYGGYGLKSNNDYYWTGRAERKYSEVVRDRWTEATKTTATYPRLTTTNGDNNFRNSDFWLYSSDRFELSMAQLTWNLPVKMFGSELVKDLSLYVGGYNLFTFSKERKHLETNIGSAPQTRFYNLGLKITF